MSYRIGYDTEGLPIVIRDSDGATIPQEASNADFRAFLGWNAAQTVPLDYTTPGAKARKPRTLLAIHADVMALSKPQLDAVWADLSSGTPEKHLKNSGPNTPTIFALHCVGKIGSAPDTHTQVGIIVFFVADNPAYLVNPAFDPTINIDGSEPG